jgi:predicted transcriptional regulator
MPVDKLSVSLPSELVAALDELARVDGATRSAIIREATASYVAGRRSAHYESARRDRIDAALAGFDEIAQSWGEDDRSGLDYLAEARGEISAGDRDAGHDE